MLSTVLGFCEGRVIVPSQRRRLQVFPRVGVIMNLKRFDVLLENKLSVIRWYFFCFLLVFCWRGKMTNTSSNSLRTFHIYRRLNGRRECKVQYRRIEFCDNLAQLFILSYLTTPWKMFTSKSTRALICFSSTIDENTDTVHLTEGFVIYWNSHTLGSGRRITIW